MKTSDGMFVPQMRRILSKHFPAKEVQDLPIDDLCDLIDELYKQSRPKAHWSEGCTARDAEKVAAVMVAGLFAKEDK
jgi:hypothetical protein